MQSKLLSFLQSILLCGPAVGTCTTFPTWDHLIVFLKKRKNSVTLPRTGRESVWRSVDREEGTGLAATYGRPGGDKSFFKSHQHFEWTHIMQGKSCWEGALVDKTANPHLSFLLPTKRRGAKYFEHNAASLRSREEVGDVLASKEPGWTKENCTNHLLGN